MLRQQPLERLCLVLEKHLIEELRDAKVELSIHSELNQGLLLLGLDIAIFLLK